ncbi:MAG: OmpA family protein [Gallionella sp.]|nr:OmpA family protein [Gallionella sp.]
MSSPFALADDAGWYAGASVGQSRAKIDDARITATLVGVGPASIIDDNRASAYKLFGGYLVNQNFALEGGYFDLGQFGYTATILAPAGTLTGKIKLRGVNIDAVGILPMTEQFSAFGRVGLIYAQARDNFTSTGAIAMPANPSPSESKINYKFGAGLQYNLTESLGMRAEAERYRINDAVGNKGDINMYSLGLVYRLGVKIPTPAPRAAVYEPIVAAATPAPAPKPVKEIPAPPPPAKRKVTFSADSSADSLFGFGKATVSPAGQQALDKFAGDLKDANFEVITVTGHTDRIGSHAYNQKLSTRRAETVKAYLVESAGIPSDKITANGVDGSNPVTKPGECKGDKATKELIACLAPDRRVEVEVTATRTSIQ